MYFIAMLLYNEEFLDDILTIFVEEGINDAVVVEGRSMGRTLAFEVPIFAGLKRALEYNRRYSYAIFAFAKDEYTIREVVASAKEQGMDLDKPGVGLLTAMPVGLKFGSLQELSF